MHFKCHTTFIEVVDGMETSTIELFSSITFITEMKGRVINWTHLFWYGLKKIKS